MEGANDVSDVYWYEIKNTHISPMPLKRIVKPSKIPNKIQIA